MSATVITFPGVARAAAGRQLGETKEDANLRSGCAAPPISASSLATKFVDHFLPIVQASVDLLEADECDFEDRCRRMLDTDGTTLIDELCAEMEIVGRQMRFLVDGLDLTRARLRTAITRLAVLTEASRGNR